MLSPAGEWVSVSLGSDGVTIQEVMSGRMLASFPAIADRDSYVVAGDLKSLARNNFFGARMVGTSSKDDQLVELPNLGVNTISALAAMRDGFVFANSDGIVGLASLATAKLRVFATDHIGIGALAVSPDNKRIAVGDSGGNVTIWELR